MPCKACLMVRERQKMRRVTTSVSAEGMPRRVCQESRVRGVLQAEGVCVVWGQAGQNCHTSHPRLPCQQACHASLFM